MSNILKRSIILSLLLVFCSIAIGKSQTTVVVDLNKEMQKCLEKARKDTKDDRNKIKNYIIEIQKKIDYLESLPSNPKRAKQIDDLKKDLVELQKAFEIVDPEKRARRCISFSGLCDQIEIKEEMELKSKLNKLYKQLETTRNELGKLTREIQSNDKLLAEWYRVSNKAVENAWMQLRDDIFGGYVLDELFKKVDLIEKTATLKDIKAINDLKTLKKWDNLFGWKNRLTKSELSAEDTYNIIANALMEPIVYKNLARVIKKDAKYIKFVGGFAKYAMVATNAWHNALKSYLSWKRIDQMDKNTIKFLVAVNEVSDQMKRVMEQLNETQKELEIIILCK